jgi:hypothetical protein
MQGVENPTTLWFMRTGEESFVSVCSSSALQFRACALSNHFSQIVRFLQSQAMLKTPSLLEHPALSPPC